jgi:hypothetical protein
MRIKLHAREYSRYAGMHQIGATLYEATPAQTCEIALTRLDGYGDIAVQTITPPTESAPITFDLRDLTTHLDPDLNWARQGDYAIVAREPEGGPELARSRSFAVRTVPISELKHTYLMGLPLHVEAVLAPVAQPKAITGVAITYVDPGMLKGPGVLVYQSEPRALSWRGGPLVQVDGDDLQTLTLLTPEGDAYVQIEVDPDLLPDSSMPETLIIDNWRLTDERLMEYLARAYGTIQTRLQLQLETAIITTDPAAGLYYDQIADARIYESGKMTTIPLETPLARPLQRVITIEGWHAGQHVLSLPDEWITINERSAIITLVPTTGSALLQTHAGTYLYGLLRQRRFIADFWHFRVVSGLRALDGDYTPIREAIGIQAALSALQDLSLAATTGRTSRSASREGVSENWSYSPQGAYSEKIGYYQQWLDTNLPRLRQRFAGPNIVVL